MHYDRPNQYKDWIHWLEQRSPMPETGPSLEPIQKALAKTQLLQHVNPKNVIHVAGTNGKGTTAKTLQKLLVSQGLNVGLYTSPHLVDTCERIAVNDQIITTEEFVHLLNKHYVTTQEYKLSHFEALTLIAVDYFFTEKKVDKAIFEIGLGGTWDATNAIPHETSIITALGLDHQHILGNTLEEIAENKFGIIRQQNSVFHYPLPNKKITEHFQEIIKTREANDFEVIPPKFSIESGSPLPRYFLQTSWGAFPLSLPGKRAVENMWLAFSVYCHLGFPAQDGLKALSKIEWPARMTPLPINGSTPIYLSGDHNIQGLQSLVEILSHSRYENLILILGLSKNRSHREFIQELQKLPRHKILLTKPSFRGVDPGSSEETFYEKPHEALLAALSMSSAQDLIVITGSLYLCGDIMRHFQAPCAK